jgi:hypothetical protein
MSLLRYETITRSCAAPALAVMIAVCLTGCSDLLKEVEGASASIPSLVASAEAAPSPETKAEAPATAKAEETPKLPPNLVACINKKEDLPKDAKTADQKVTARNKINAEKIACARALIAWYGRLAAAKKAAAEAGQKKKG